MLDPAAIRGHWAPFAPRKDEAHRAAYHPQWGFRWSMNWTEAIERFVRPLDPPPTLLLLNMGQWGALPGEGYARSLLAAAQRAVGLPPQGNSLRLQLDAIVAAVEGRR